LDGIVALSLLEVGALSLLEGGAIIGRGLPCIRREHFLGLRLFGGLRLLGGQRLLDGLRLLGVLLISDGFLEGSDPGINVIASRSEIGLRWLGVGTSSGPARSGPSGLEVTGEVVVGVREIESIRLEVRSLHLRRRRGA
jgi:hypothetical protein